jgi:hypothetical protein
MTLYGIFKNKFYTMNLRNNFEKNGYLHFPSFLKNEDFFNLSDELKVKITKKLEEIDLKKIGGYKVGNLGLYAGNYAVKLWNLLLKENLEKKVLEIFDKPLSDFTIRISGNINFPNKGDQYFHTDGSFDQKMYLISLATEDIREESGPTEIVLNTSYKLPYWKFVFKKKEKKKLILSKGDLVIRKHALWHRGTKNLSDKPRFLISFLLFDKTSKYKSNFEDNLDIQIFNIFFTSDPIGRFKEEIYIKLPFLFQFYRFIKSILN